MSTDTTTPAGGAPANVNRIGLTRAEYDGSKTTLCPGCGHNAITGGIIQAAWEAGLEPHRVAIPVTAARRLGTAPTTRKRRERSRTESSAGGRSKR